MENANFSLFSSKPKLPFDANNIWLASPRVAILELLDSVEFLTTNRSIYAAIPIGHKLREKSTHVYLAMFDKFTRYLIDKNINLIEMNSQDYCQFMDGSLDTSLGKRSKQTRIRYARLMERIFQHLLQIGVRDSNPVTDWIKTNKGINPETEASPPDAKDDIKASKVHLLQDWLFTSGCAHLEAGEWREARDTTLTSLSLGTGMRCAELVKLTEGQVQYWPGGPTSDRFVFKIPGWASVETSREHEAFASRECVDLMERWWNKRWVGFESATGERKLPAGNRVFPATLTGKQLSPSTLFRNIKKVATNALQAGALDESTQWVLLRGAQGLRRAYVLTALELKCQPSMLTKNLGHWSSRSVHRYINDSDASETQAESISKKI